MKIIYNNTELQHNNKSYNVLINKPSLNGHLLEGNVSLDTLSLYDKPTTEKLVEATSQIRLVSTMPADPEPNMTYYVGPDERNLYDVILVNDAKQLIRMGTTQFGQYKSGPGVNVKFDNTINVNTDDVSIYIDSEGNIASSLDGNAIPPFTGATTSAAGTKGVAPKPVAGQQGAVLLGNSTWVNFIDMLYPVGAIMITNSSLADPNSFYPGTTWEKLDAGYTIWIDSEGGGGTIDPALPNIKGDSRGLYYNPYAGYTWSGAVVKPSADGAALWHTSDGGRYGWSFVFSAKEANSVYSDNHDHVTPQSYLIVAWKRTA